MPVYEFQDFDKRLPNRGKGYPDQRNVRPLCKFEHKSYICPIPIVGGYGGRALNFIQVPEQLLLCCSNRLPASYRDPD